MDSDRVKNEKWWLWNGMKCVWGHSDTLVVCRRSVCWPKVSGCARAPASCIQYKQMQYEDVGQILEHGHIWCIVCVHVRIHLTNGESGSKHGQTFRTGSLRNPYSSDKSIPWIRIPWWNLCGMLDQVLSQILQLLNGSNIVNCHWIVCAWVTCVAFKFKTCYHLQVQS